MFFHYSIRNGAVNVVSLFAPYGRCRKSDVGQDREYVNVQASEKRIFSNSEGWQHLVFHYFCKAMDSFRHCGIHRVTRFFRWVANSHVFLWSLVFFWIDSWNTYICFLERKNLQEDPEGLVLADFWSDSHRPAASLRGEGSGWSSASGGWQPRGVRS